MLAEVPGTLGTICKVGKHRLKGVRLIEQHRLDTREVALMDLPELLVQFTCERPRSRPLLALKPEIRIAALTFGSV